MCQNLLFFVLGELMSHDSLLKDPFLEIFTAIDSYLTQTLFLLKDECKIF